MKQFNDLRADRAFLEIGKLISGFRNSNPEYTNEEMAYALLQISCSGIDDGGHEWFAFLCDALRECILQEES